MGFLFGSVSLRSFCLASLLSLHVQLLKYSLWPGNAGASTPCRCSLQVYLHYSRTPGGADRGCSWWLHQEPARAMEVLERQRTKPNTTHQSELISACSEEHGWSETALRIIEPIKTGAEQEISQVFGYVLFLHCHQPGSRMLHHWDSPGVGQEFSTRSTSK